MNIINVGNQIAELRKAKGITQNELGERLGVSFQAVSKWERGETLPDTAILPDLANVLETTVDYILLGGEKTIEYKGKKKVSDIAEGLKCIKKIGDLLGKDSLIYRYAVKGINEGMNTNIEDAFTDDYAFESFLAEVIIQNLILGVYFDITDIKNNFKSDHFKDIVLNFCAKYGIK